MSHQAMSRYLPIMISIRERLVAFYSRASRTPKTVRGPARWRRRRSGLRRSRSLRRATCSRARGLVVVEHVATGRDGRHVVVGVRRDRAVVGRGINQSRARWSSATADPGERAHLLLAAMAALADEQRLVRALRPIGCPRRCTRSDLPPGPGRVALLGQAGPAWAERPGRAIRTAGDRGPGSRSADVRPPSGRRVAPPSGQRPLLASVTAAPALAHPPARTSTRVDRSRAQTAARTDRFRPRPSVTAGVSRRKAGAGDTSHQTVRPAPGSVLKAGADRTLSRETPAKTPAETPARNARAGANPRTPEPLTPPAPLEGGASLTRSCRGDVPHRARSHTSATG